jgi:hypothetical protein
MAKQRYKYLDMGVIRVYTDNDEPGKATGAPCGRQWQVLRQREVGGEYAIGRIAKMDNGYWYASPMLDRSPVDSECPGRHIGNTKLEMVFWLQGVHDASQGWFKRAIKEARAAR